MADGKKKAVMESSDDEELFSYLEQVHEHKQKEKVGSNEVNKTVESDISKKTSAKSDDKNLECNNGSNSGPSRPLGKLENAIDRIKRISEKNLQNEDTESSIIVDMETVDKEARKRSNSGEEHSSQLNGEKTLNAIQDSHEIKSESEVEIASKTCRNQHPVYTRTSAEPSIGNELKEVEHKLRENKVKSELEITSESNKNQHPVITESVTELPMVNEMEKVEQRHGENQMSSTETVQVTKENIPENSHNFSSINTLDLEKDLTTLSRSTEDGSQQNVEKVVAKESQIQQHLESSDQDKAIYYKQTPDTSDTSRGSDKYYLINEKDWLSLCAKISNNNAVTGACSPDIQKTETSPSKDQRSVPAYGSMFNAFKQYSPITKASLNKGDLVQLSHKDENHKEGNNLYFNSNTEMQYSNKSKQNVSTFDTEGIQVLKSTPEKVANKTNPGTPKVEIVYIRLEDDQVKYDSSKSLTSLSDNTKVEAVKKLEFSEDAVHTNENKRLRGTTKENEGRGITRKRKTSSQKRRSKNFVDLTEAVQDSSKEHEPFVPNLLFDNTVNTGCSTGSQPGMQVRFVRINNKLTRVYENVVEEPLDLYTSGGHDIPEETEVYDKEKSELEQVYDENDSFDFNDSQLVAFPVNAVDPDNIIQDDSIAELTPSKLQMLTPSKLEMFSPSKFEILTPSKLDILDEQYDENADRNFSPPDQYTAKSLPVTGPLNEKVETEATIVLKVTRSGELVECESNEISPGKKLAEPESPMRDIESRSRNRNSHIRNIWKNVKPLDNKRKEVKQSSLFDVTEDSDAEIIEIDTKESSDEDDLANYFSKTHNTSENSVSSQCISKSDNASSRPTCTISIQASFSDSDDSDAGDTNPGESGVKSYSTQSRQKELEPKITPGIVSKDKVKLNSDKLNTSEEIISKLRQKVGKIKTVESEIGKLKDKEIQIHVDSEIKCDGAPSGTSKRSNSKNKNEARLSPDDKGTKISDDTFSSEENIPKKRKGSTQIRAYFKDVDYKQVDFKDFEVTETGKSQSSTVTEKKQIPENKNEAKALPKRTVKNKKKETCKELVSDGNKEIIESKKELNSTKKRKDRKETTKVKIERKATKKSCLKSGQQGNETEIKSVDRNDTGKLVESGIKSTIRFDDIDDNSINDGQKEIDFLEKKQIPENKNKAKALPKRNVIKKKKETCKELVSDGNREIKESEKDLNSTKKRKDRKETTKVEIKRKTTKKSCLKNGQQGNETEIKSVDRNDTGKLAESSTESTVRFDDKDDNSVNDQGQKKIEFLEKLFQIKLKEAADTTSRICKNNPKSSFKDIAAAESTYEQNPNSKTKSIRKRGKAKLTVKLPKTNVCKKSKIVHVSDLSNEKAINCQKGNNEEKELLNIRRTARKRKPKQVDDEMFYETNTRKNEPVTGQCSKRKRPRKSKTINLDVASEKRVVENKSGAKRKRTQKNQCQPENTEFKKRKSEGGGPLESSSEIKSMKIKRPKGQQKNLEKSPQTTPLKKTTSQSCDSASMDILHKKSDKKTVVTRQKRRQNSRNNKVQYKSSKTESLKDNFDTGQELEIYATTYDSEILCERCGCKIPNVTEYAQQKSSETLPELPSPLEIPDYCENCSKMKETLTLIDEQAENRKTNVKFDAVSVECSENINSEGDVISNLAKFQPLNQKGKTAIKTETSKKKESNSKSKKVRQRKKLNVQSPTSDKTKEETKNQSNLGKRILKDKCVKEDSDKPSDTQSDDMALDLSIPKEKDEEVSNDSLSKKEGQEKSRLASPRKLRDGKELQQSSSGKALGLKNLKPTKKLPSGGKLKTKRFGIESWKDKLEDKAFKFDFEERKNEIHKPVNVKHMIRNILKTVKGAEVKKEKKVKHIERKDKVHNHKKGSDRQAKQRLTSESDDAWLSDSGPSGSFPAFKFSVTSNAVENRESDILVKKLENRIDEPLVNTNENTKVTNFTTKQSGNANELSESQSVKLEAAGVKDIEMHPSPLTVSSQLKDKEENIAPAGNSTKLSSDESDKSIKHVGCTKESPDMKKNVDKLRALLDKVSEKKGVKRLKFTDNIGSSDSEH